MKNKKKETNSNEKIIKFKHPNDIKGSLKITRIYLVSNCFGDLNKVYVGKEKSHQVNSREYNHKKTFGKNANFEYIDQCESWDRKEWLFLETFWIQHFKNYNYELMNKNKGGGGFEFCTQETKNKISKSKKGRSWSWNGKQHSEESKRKIGNAHRGLKYSEESCRKISINRTGIKDVWGKKIIQMSLEGEFIKEWSSIIRAEEALNLTTIGLVLSGRQNKAGGFKWKYKNS